VVGAQQLDIYLVRSASTRGWNPKLITSTILCIALEIAIWTVDDLITNAVLYSIIGILLGPMYPIVIMVVIDVLPPELHAGTIGWCASLGQAGSAIMPL